MGVNWLSVPPLRSRGSGSGGVREDANNRAGVAHVWHTAGQLIVSIPLLHNYYQLLGAAPLTDCLSLDTGHYCDPGRTSKAKKKYCLFPVTVRKKLGR